MKGSSLRPIMTAENHYVFYYPNGKNLEEMRAAAEHYFGTYVEYTSKPFNGTYYYELLNNTVPGTELQRYIAQSNQTMVWAAESTMEQDLRYGNFHRVGENCFICTVEFAVDKTATTWVEEVSSTESNTEELVFLLVGNKWCAAAMSVIAD